MLRTIPYAPTRTEAERLRTVFTRWCGDHSYEAASEALERDWDRMVTFYDFPKEHWGHLRTTNPVESPFAALRLRTDAAKRYKRVDRAIAVIWKMLMVAEQRFRRLKAPELIQDVYLGAQYVDGIAIGEGQWSCGGTLERPSTASRVTSPDPPCAGCDTQWTRIQRSPGCPWSTLPTGGYLAPASPWPLPGSTVPPET